MIAYCAPGRRITAALTLALHGTLDDVTAIEETPHLDGDVIIVIPDPVTFTIPDRPDPPAAPRRPPPPPFTSQPGDPFRLGSLA